MDSISKVFIMTGAVLIIGGLCFHWVGKISGMGRLPGDIFIENEHFTLYIPMATCIIISLILSVIFFLWNQR